MCVHAHRYLQGFEHNRWVRRDADLELGTTHVHYFHLTLCRGWENWQCFLIIQKYISILKLNRHGIGKIKHTKYFYKYFLDILHNLQYLYALLVYDVNLNDCQFNTHIDLNLDQSRRHKSHGSQKHPNGHSLQRAVGTVQTFNITGQKL